MNIKIFDTELEASQYVSKLIIKKIKLNPEINLGLATGSTPVILYKELIKDYKNNKTDWSHVKTFNLDEYEGIKYDSDISYHKFMKDQLFDFININLNNTFFPEKNIDFDQVINSHDGIDLQILGIGINGHIGFNEPGSSKDSKTRVVDLAHSTIEVNGNKYFNGNLDEVPKQAISMGLKTIMQAKQIVLLAFGKSKANAIKQLMEIKEFDINFPASILLEHSNVLVVVDKDANI